MPFLLWIVTVYVVVSIVAFAAYGIDKRRAKRGQRRISERTLHLLELAGGWPGAAVGQIVFRHKRCKLTYMLVFGVIVVGHAAAWGGCWWLGWLSCGNPWVPNAFLGGGAGVQAEESAPSRR